MPGMIPEWQDACQFRSKTQFRLPAIQLFEMSHTRFQISRTSAVPSAARVTLLFPRIAVRVVAIAFPEAQAIMIQEHEPAYPFDALPRI